MTMHRAAFVTSVPLVLTKTPHHVCGRSAHPLRTGLTRRTVHPRTPHLAPKPAMRRITQAVAEETGSKIDRSGDVRATLAWIAVAAGVAAAFGVAKGTTQMAEFLTAYIVEYSLSVDNLFVFLLIFRYFNVGREQQGRVLTWGIVGAMVMRGGMIVVGEALTKRFEFVTVGFAALLLFSAAKLLLGADEEEEEDLSENGIVKFSRRLLPFGEEYDGVKFFSMKNGVRLATPLLLVLFCVEFSDVVFALDSVPAVLGISDDTSVIYVSNILAIMGLRNLFFVLEDVIGELRYLPQSLAVVLGFVGGKMIGGVFGYKIGVLESLCVVIGSLSVGVGLSVLFPGKEESAEEELEKESV